MADPPLSAGEVHEIVALPVSRLDVMVTPVGAAGLPIGAAVAALEDCDEPAAELATTVTEYVTPAVRFSKRQLKVAAFALQVKVWPPPVIVTT